ncbi:MAG: hypothetical protein ISS35_08835 [Kiritimatiellae bacterium]|nr:hypothetical protein [Kiritimatiellia bacterium]
MTKQQGTTLLVTVAILALIVSGSVNSNLYRLRTGDRETPELEGGTPLVTFATVVLGGFRGIIADVLWLRATYLQDEGRFFELAQLSDWITQLDAHRAEIWAYHAWNMAYNISALMTEDEERWRWVTQGLNLLQNRGLPINPDDATLYAELAWIYQQKIGSTLDHSHAYYKRQWAQSISEALPPGGFLSQTNTKGAPRTGPPKDLLRKRWYLNVKQMSIIDARFGPLDWRTAEAHAIYWAWVGREKRGLAAQLQCERSLYQSLNTLFFRGRIPATLPSAGFPSRARPDLFEKCCLAFESATTRYPDDENILTAYRLFLQSAVLLLDACQNDTQAHTALKKLNALDGANHSDVVDAFVQSFDLQQLSGMARASILQERRFSKTRTSHKTNNDK